VFAVYYCKVFYLCYFTRAFVAGIYSYVNTTLTNFTTDAAEQLIEPALNHMAWSRYSLQDVRLLQIYYCSEIKRVRTKSSETTLNGVDLKRSDGDKHFGFVGKRTAACIVISV